MADETVLITGGTGFIGAYTAKDLLEREHDVALFDIRTESPVLENLEIDAPVIQGDITDPTDLFRAIRETGATRVIHLAALLTDRTRSNPRTAVDVNIQGTNAVFEAARTFDEQLERIAWASSSAVYAPPDAYESRSDDGGSERDDRQLDESDLATPATLYGAAKTYNERQAEVYRTEFGVSHVGLRPTLVYGPHRESGSATAFARIIEGPALGESVRLGPADHVLDWQHVEDVAQAFRKAVFAPEADLTRRAYNVCGSQATLAEVASVVEDVVPDADITVVDDGEIPWTHTLDDEAARSDFGYEPEYGLREGVEQYVDALRTERTADSK